MKVLRPLMILILASGIAAAQSTQQEDTVIRAGGLSFLDLFGMDVNLDGSVALAGASGSSTTGAVFVFREQAGLWVEAQTLTPSDGQPDDDFGIAVAVQGGTAFCSSYRHDTVSLNEGAVYVFEEVAGSLVETQKLVASDPDISDWFGLSLDFDGTTLVVGCPNDVDNAIDAGAAFVFEHDGSSWVEAQKLVPLDPQLDQEFGWSVAVDGDRIVVGARQDNWSSNGCAYVFQKSGSSFAQEQKLIASDTDNFHRAGISTAISGDTLLFGADHEFYKGAVYVFEYDGSSWVEEAVLQAPNGANDEEFGIDVDLDDAGNAVIGRPGGINGDSFLYRRSSFGWLTSLNLVSSAGGTLTMGRKICVDGGRVLSGAPTGNSFRGEVYVHAIPELILGASDVQLAQGETLSLVATGGQPFEIGLLAIFAIQGSPFWHNLILSPFSLAGELALSGPVPSDLVGLSIDFVSMGTVPSGTVEFSNILGVEF